MKSSKASIGIYDSPRVIPKRIVQDIYGFAVKRKGEVQRTIIPQPGMTREQLIRRIGDPFQDFGKIVEVVGITTDARLPHNIKPSPPKATKKYENITSLFRYKNEAMTLPKPKPEKKKHQRIGFQIHKGFAACMPRTEEEK
jgi:hypothetical protein